jgi:tRNA (guanosine-2'-O-)-methyltransferase
VSGQRIRVKTREEIAGQRRPRRHQCWDHLIAAPPWPLHGANLGTLLRTGDAVGAGASLNVAVAGSLVLYRLAGLI